MCSWWAQPEVGTHCARVIVCLFLLKMPEWKPELLDFRDLRRTKCRFSIDRLGSAFCRSARGPLVWPKFPDWPKPLHPMDGVQRGRFLCAVPSCFFSKKGPKGDWHVFARPTRLDPSGFETRGSSLWVSIPEPGVSSKRMSSFFVARLKYGSVSKWHQNGFCVLAVSNHTHMKQNQTIYYFRLTPVCSCQGRGPWELISTPR